MIKIDNFNKFLKTIPIALLSEKISNNTGEGFENTVKILKTYINEARAALDFIHPLLTHHNDRILEVGAGLCIVSLFLKEEGFNIVALEPTTGGFDFFSVFQQVIIEHYRDTKLDILPYPAKDLSKKNVGTFDLIFSFNVIEHIPDPFSTLHVLLKLLNAKGKMAHACPNYLIPYEPHFGIPVLASWPKLSNFFFFKKISGNRELWDSLNFITSLEVKRFAKQHNLSLQFSQGLLADAFIRLKKDPIFRERQKNIFVMMFFLIMHFPGGLNLLKKLPPSCTTPMQFTLSKPEPTDKEKNPTV
jgi:2-polyprenyl-3-methyl-5-hydroxy-6-metoxy-1,4-benzoquinol methylase